ncbi:MAG: hypothetical protein BWY87_01688 [Deltaproteobacteria bacterium ADurb.Bin510]|nr:MAG: hypothetical protein BWY87_01688 [Deltaproteobacteria bacterium ADurb.Bin510]
MDDLDAYGLGEVAGLVDHAVLVGGRDLALDGDHALAADALDVAAGDAGIDFVDPNAGHALGFLDGVVYGIDGLFHVDDQAALEALGFGGAEADDLEFGVFGYFCD